MYSRASVLCYTLLVLFLLLTLLHPPSSVDAKGLKKLKKLLKPKKLGKLLPYLLMAPKIFIVQKENDGYSSGHGSYGSYGSYGGGYGSYMMNDDSGGAQELGKMLSGILDQIISLSPSVDVEKHLQNHQSPSSQQGYGGAYQHFYGRRR